MPKSNAELREKCDAADDVPVDFDALDDEDPVVVVAAVPDVVVLALVVAGIELAVPLEEDVAEDAAEDEVIELEEPLPLE